MRDFGFLLDEHVSSRLKRAVLEIDPDVVVLFVGESGAPARGTPDPELLNWMEERGFLLVTNNRATMPGHLRAHLARGRHGPGILILPEGQSNRTLAEELVLIRIAGDSQQFRDQIVFLPIPS